MTETGAAEALRQAAYALGNAADALDGDLLAQHDEHCEWNLDEWYEDDCQCLGRAGQVELARIQEEAKAKTPKARATPKTPSAPREHSSAKKFRLAAEACGFEVWSIPGGAYVKPATYYATTSDAHKEGDLKAAEKEFPRWVLKGRHKAVPDELAFEASWADGFMGARLIDPTGKDIELRANYYYSAGQAKNLGYTSQYAEKVGQERTYRYNDGGTYSVNRWRATTFEEFTLWIDSIIDALRVDYKHITTVRKAKAAKSEEDIMYELLNPKSNR